MSHPENSPASSLRLFSDTAAGAQFLGELPLTGELKHTIQALSGLCEDHGLEELDVAWVQTNIPSPQWLHADMVPELKIWVTPDDFRLEGNLKGTGLTITTAPIALSRLRLTDNDFPLEVNPSFEESPSNA